MKKLLIIVLVLAALVLGCETEYDLCLMIDSAPRIFLPIFRA